MHTKDFSKGQTKALTDEQIADDNALRAAAENDYRLGKRNARAAAVTSMDITMYNIYYKQAAGRAIGWN